MDYSSSQESASKTPFTRKSLEPITEESITSSAGVVTPSRISHAFNDSSSSSKSINGARVSKPCPFTQGECPTKLSMMEERASGSTYSDWSSTFDGSRRSYSSLLEKPFLFRRASSLNEAVVQQEVKLTELYLNNLAIEPQTEEAPIQLFSRHSSSITITEEEATYTVDSKSQTDFSDSVPNMECAKKELNYLMGLSTECEEKEGREEEGEGGSQRSAEDMDNVYVDEKEEISGETEAMRQAQRYLRVHRIFEFYQFLVAHLLSAAPENPINFLLDLLDRCIIYRAGLGNPPLLYDKKHLTALFNLMDRMRTGYIDKDQYVVGMKTLGICSFNPDPPTTEDMVHKDFFVEEAYENLVSMLNDILRRRWIYFSTQPPSMKTPPPTPQFSARSGKTSASGKRQQIDK
ncbi:hypothetical protein Trydic_g16720 [Trypoxylus dichotomus]